MKEEKCNIRRCWKQSNASAIPQKLVSSKGIKENARKYKIQIFIRHYH